MTDAANLQTQQIVRPERSIPTKSYYLAEGATGGFFSTDILLANPNSARRADPHDVLERRRHGR